MPFTKQQQQMSSTTQWEDMQYRLLVQTICVPLQLTEFPDERVQDRLLLPDTLV